MSSNRTSQATRARATCDTPSFVRSTRYPATLNLRTSRASKANTMALKAQSSVSNLARNNYKISCNEIRSIRSSGEHTFRITRFSSALIRRPGTVLAI